jgi:hypothetical protein
VSRSVEDIRVALAVLAERWATYSGTERAASQTFLNQLVSAYTGAPDAMAAGARFEEFGIRDEGSGFMDLFWQDVAIIEMKAPNQSRRLDQHRAQALDYWRNSANQEASIAAPPFLVLCSIQQFEVWQPGKFPNAPVDVFALTDLPDRVESLLFLAGRTPIFGGPGAAVTEQAAQHMVALYFSLRERRAAEPAELRRFIIQTVWALFAEDLGIVEGKPLETLATALLADPTRSTAVELAHLYRRFNIQEQERRNRGAAQSVPHVNGELFSVATEVHLEPSELKHLLEASKFDWRHVNPTVFGALLEGCLGKDLRWELGAHYTSEEDIMTIVNPVIVRPWVTRIEATRSYRDATQLLEELCKFRVLDPAMGCANFLAIAYRAIRQLEMRIHDRLVEYAKEEGRQAPLSTQYYPIDNIMGIEIDRFAVDIAKATLWMMHALESRRHRLAEPVLPLPTLKNLTQGDSLKIEWPEADAIIGNPPFHGDKRMREVLGDDYIKWLKAEFNIGVKDHCVYFFLRAHQYLRPGRRAGLVATKSISETKNRDASLVTITKHDGVITDAVSRRDWSGEAAVDVSIICWTKTPPKPTEFILDGEKVNGITPSLRRGTSHREPLNLAPNERICFQGFLTRGMGFVISDVEANDLISRGGQNYCAVVAPFLNGDDITKRAAQDPSRWVIDFADRPLEEVRLKFPLALSVLEERVLPERQKGSDDAGAWWRFHRPRMLMRSAIEGLERFAVCGLTGKRLILVWAERNWRPSHACGVFAFSDDFNFGVCSSKIHDLWGRAVSSTLEDRMRYTPSISFNTFPFPRPNDVAIGRVAQAIQHLVSDRRQACESLDTGLTKVYNMMDEGGFRELKAAHDELDLAVMDAYGLDADLLNQPERLLDTLFDLNEKAATDPNYKPFGERGSSMFDETDA